MNILIVFLIIFTILNILKAYNVIDSKFILLFVFLITGLSLIISLFLRFYPSYIPKNKNFSKLCFVNEKKNKLGPSKCFFNSDCKGNRYCSSRGECTGDSGC